MLHRSANDLNRYVVHQATGTEHTINPTTRLIGVEIEVASGNQRTVTDTLNRWHGNITGDGSLPSTGFEIRTAPASGDRFVRQVTDIANAMSDAHCTISPACGLHVHIDARDLDYTHIRRLVRLYAPLEPTLFALLPVERRRSQYARPCGQVYRRALRPTLTPQSAEDAMHLLDATIYGYEPDDVTPQQIREWKSSHGANTRYHALNLHSWGFRGTVECRMFPGTVSAEKITSWGMLWAALVQHAHDTSERTLERLAAGITDTDRGLAVLRELAPTPAVSSWIADRYRRMNPVAEPAPATTYAHDANVLRSIQQMQGRIR